MENLQTGSNSFNIKSKTYKLEGRSRKSFGRNVRVCETGDTVTLQKPEIIHKRLLADFTHEPRAAECCQITQGYYCTTMQPRITSPRMQIWFVYSSPEVIAAVVCWDSHFFNEFFQYVRSHSLQDQWVILNLGSGLQSTQDSSIYSVCLDNKGIVYKEW